MKLVFITSGFLPIPATKGGAVENLVVNILNENEKNKKLKIEILSIYEKSAEQEAKKYKYATFKFIKVGFLVKILDKLIFLIAKNILKKSNSQSYRYIVQRLLYLNKCSKILKNGCYDKVILENHPTQFLALKWRKNYLKYADNYYYHSHNEFSGTYGCLDIIKKTKKFICVSKYIKNVTSNYLKMDKNKFVVLRNCINYELFSKQISESEKNKLKNKYGIKNDEKILLFTGRIVPEKGVMELLKALEKVKYDKYKLLIIGSALNELKTKTTYQSEIERTVKNLQDKVIFTGFVKYDEIHKFYSIADIAVLPSIWDDPAPLTIIEALVSGLPIITTNSGGIPEYAKDGSAIILDRINNNLIENLSNEIDNLLIDAGKRENMSKVSKKVSEDLTTGKYYYNFYNIFESSFYKNVLFDTSSGSQNMGDYVIVNSVQRELNYVLNDNFLVKYSTHTPVSHFYQNIKRNGLIKYTNSSKYKFIAGTNLLNYNMLLPWNNWNVNIFNYKPYKNAILVGAGMNPNAKKVNLYTKWLYKKILSKNYIHSVRDERTKKFLESIGLKAINTGCATMWCLTENFCKTIPKMKSKNVIFTLTDYCPDIENDQKLINMLLKNYEKVYFWIQGSKDYEYINKFDNISKIIFVNPNLESYEKILNEGIDYVGTRLHAGIFAMQHHCRSIIIGVDNRALDIKQKYNINCFYRNDIETIEKFINSTFETNVCIDEEAILDWKKQFYEK